MELKMGLFYRDDRPGRGVEKEILEKNGFFVFFDVLFRKFMRFVQVNGLYLLCCIPYFILLYWVSPLNTTVLMGTELAPYISALSVVDAALFDITLRVMFAMCILIFWGAGPASAGLAYVLRNFAREEHAWVGSDFWEQSKSNAKQGAIVLLVDLAVLYLSGTALRFYAAEYAVGGQTGMLVAMGLLVVVLLLYTFMHFYVYQLMVTFDTKMGTLYRNAFLFAIAKFPQNLFFALLCFVVFAALFVWLHLFAMLLYVLGLAAILMFIPAFYAARVIAQNTERQ